MAWIWLVLYFCGSAGLVWHAVHEFHALNSPMSVTVARSGGANLNFHAVLLVGTMLRHTSNLIGNNRYVAELFPLAVTVPLHKLFAVMNIFWVIVHTAGHLAHFALFFSAEVAVDFVFTNNNKLGWAGVSAGATGVALFILFAAIVTGYILAHSRFMEKHSFSFEIFYFSHFLTFVYFAVMIVHAPSCWRWLVVPLGLYLIEWLYRLVTRNEGCRAVTMKNLPSGVTMIELKRTNAFREWLPGSYAFINIPEISYYQWHPFTIASSSLKPAETITFFIRVKNPKSWTFNLRAAIANGGVESMSRRKGILAAMFSSLSASILPVGVGALTFHLDGPYGAPTQRVFSCKHSILVAAGIGVTPSRAILDHLYYICKAGDDGAADRSSELGSLERLDFCWLYNDVDAAAWFTPLLSAIEKEIQDNPHSSLAKILHIHLFLTSLNTKADKDSLTLHLAVDALIGTDDMATGFNWSHETEDHPILHLREKLHTGHPDWKAHLQNFKTFSPDSDEMTVFFCGPDALGKTTAAACALEGVKFRQEVF